VLPLFGRQPGTLAGVTLRWRTHAEAFRWCSPASARWPPSPPTATDAPPHCSRTIRTARSSARARTDSVVHGVHPLNEKKWPPTIRYGSEALVRPCVLAGSRLGDVMLDPSAASHDGRRRRPLQRSFVGID